MNRAPVFIVPDDPKNTAKYLGDAAPRVIHDHRGGIMTSRPSDFSKSALESIDYTAEEGAPVAHNTRNVPENLDWHKAKTKEERTRLAKREAPPTPPPTSPYKNKLQFSIAQQTKRKQQRKQKAQTIENIRASIEAVYGSLLSKLESKGLVHVTLTTEEALDHAAKTRSEKTGESFEQAKASLQNQIDYSIANQIGQHEKDHIDVKFSKNGDVQGFYDPITNKAYLVAENLNETTAPAALIHEVGIHMAGEDTALFDAAGKLVKHEKGAFFDRVRKRMHDAQETSNEEAAAYIAEEYERDRLASPTSVQKWIKDFLNHVRSWLRQHGLPWLSIKEGDIAAIAKANAQRIAKQAQAQNQNQNSGAKINKHVVSMSQGNALRPDAFSPILGEGNTFRKNLNNTNNINHKMTVMMTPPVLQFSGAAYLPIQITHGVIKKAQGLTRGKDDDSHSVMINDIEKLPELLANPIMVMQSKIENSIVIVIDAKTKTGLPIIVPIHLDVSNSTYEVTFNIHKIASVYGKNEMGSMLSYALSNNKMLYAHKARSASLIESSGLQSLKVSMNKALMRNVPNEQTIVKQFEEGLLFSKRKSPSKTTPDDFRSRLQKAMDTLGIANDKDVHIYDTWVQATAAVINARRTITNESVTSVVDAYKDFLDSKSSIQGFYTKYDKKIYLIAENIPKGNELSVLLHEYVHKNGDDLIKEKFSQLMKSLASWKDMPKNTIERRVFDKANERARASGDYGNELIPYIVEELIINKVQPSTHPNASLAEKFMGALVQAMKSLIHYVLPDAKIGHLTANDMVNLALSIAKQPNIQPNIQSIKIQNTKKPSSLSLQFSKRPTEEALAFTANGHETDGTAMDLMKKKDFEGLNLHLRTLANEAMMTLNKVFHDQTIEVKKWIEELPNTTKEIKDSIIGGMYTGASRRSAILEEAERNGGKEIKVMISQIGKKYGLDNGTAMRLVGYYLTAKYAPKANEWLLKKDANAIKAAIAKGDNAGAKRLTAQRMQRMLEINDPRTTGALRKIGVAGGLNNAQAALMISNIEKRIKPEDLAPVAKLVYKLLKWKMNLDLRMGKVDPEIVKSWPNHDDYVPLTGSPFVTLDDDIFGTGTSTPNVAKDKELKGSKSSVADDAITAVWQEINKSATHAAYQPFKRSLKAAWDDAVTRYSGNEQDASDELGITVKRQTAFERTNDDIIILRDNKDDFVIKFENQNLPKAIKKSNIEETNAVIYWAGLPTRIFSRLATQWNPTFAPINFARDLWERSENIRTKNLGVDTDAVARRMISIGLFDAESKMAIWRRLNHKQDLANKYDKYLEELIKNGGISTFGLNFARKKSDLVDDIGKSTSKLSKLEHWIEIYNNQFDFIPSLAAYVAMRESGIAVEKAAYETGNLMDFRKVGTIMQPVKALYAFSQPIVTGGANLGAVLATKKGRTRFASYAVLGAMLYAALRGMSDDDEGGNKLDQLSQFTLERSIPLPLGDGILKVPVGFGMPMLAWSWSVNAVKASAGAITIKDAAIEMTLRNAIKTFSPIQPSEISASKDPLQYLAVAMTPTIAKPFAQVAVNKSSFGSDIVHSHQTLDKKHYKSEQGRENTEQFYQDIANSIREISTIDMYPEQVKTIMNGLAVGQLREAINMTVTNPNKEERGKSTDTPLVRAFYSHYNDYAIAGQLSSAESDALDLLREKNYKGEAFYPTEVELKMLTWLDKKQKSDANFRKQKSKITKRNLNESEDMQEKNKLLSIKESVDKQLLQEYKDIVANQIK